ncbi:MAG: flagellar biosynthetic protein FliQ [Peptostreptococcaceae bacterium]|nr:flagellar biosynthetic protein FliQ [Peptostreptococcaceae bacterium]
MTNSEVIGIMQSAAMVAVKLAAPILLLSMGIGVLISILQAATQINEQTLTFVPKLILIAAVLLLTGGAMLELLQGFSHEIFDLMLK